MIGNLHDKLNIYNITNTVTQKNFITNIQNNLHIVYNTPVYSKLKNELFLLEEILINYIDKNLIDNYKYNITIAKKIIDDVIYYNINSDVIVDNINDLFIQIQKIVSYFLKDDKILSMSSYIYNEVNFIISSFTNHHDIEPYFKEKMKAYNFGSTSSVYILENNNIIIKSYNKKLRWKSEKHDNITKIFKKELKILQKLNLIYTYNEDELTMQMYYKGESLYNNFILPIDYKKQIINIFEKLDMNNIYYPEFNLNNIVILKDNISFIDYGLAEINKEFQTNINLENCKNFIEILQILQVRFKEVTDIKDIHILYNTFMNNMRISKKYLKNIF